jgi:hypothetical protein
MVAIGRIYGAEDVDIHLVLLQDSVARHHLVKGAATALIDPVAIAVTFRALKRSVVDLSKDMG